jgi:hypothetical protein
VRPPKLRIDHADRQPERRKLFANFLTGRRSARLGAGAPFPGCFLLRAVSQGMDAPFQSSGIYRAMISSQPGPVLLHLLLLPGSSSPNAFVQGMASLPCPLTLPTCLCLTFVTVRCCLRYWPYPFGLSRLFHLSRLLLDLPRLL